MSQNREYSILYHRLYLLANNTPISTQNRTSKNQVSKDHSNAKLTQNINVSDSGNKHHPKIITCNLHIKQNKNIVQTNNLPQVKIIGKIDQPDRSSNQKYNNNHSTDSTNSGISNLQNLKRGGKSTPIITSLFYKINMVLNNTLNGLIGTIQYWNSYENENKTNNTKITKINNNKSVHTSTISNFTYNNNLSSELYTPIHNPTHISNVNCNHKGKYNQYPIIPINTNINSDNINQ